MRPRDERRESHARRQARLNAASAVELEEESGQIAAVLAVAWALLDVADAIRERATSEGPER